MISLSYHYFNQVEHTFSKWNIMESNRIPIISNGIQWNLIIRLNQVRLNQVEPRTINVGYPLVSWDSIVRKFPKIISIQHHIIILSLF